MKPQSAKAKGRNLQKWVRDKILENDHTPPWIGSADVRSTGMGQTGADVQLSSEAQKHFPFAIECKNKAKVAVYKDFDQAIDHSEGTMLEPMLIIKQNQREPLVVLDAEWFIKYFLRKGV